MTDTFKGIITADGKKRQLPYANVLETPVPDETLSIQGAFADSKAVGDKFKEVKAETSSLKEELDSRLSESIDEISDPQNPFNNTDAITYKSGVTYSDTQADMIWIYNDTPIPIGNDITVTVYKHGFSHKMDVYIIDYDTHEILYKKRDASSNEEVRFYCGKFNRETILGISYVPSHVIGSGGHILKRTSEVNLGVGDILTFQDWESTALEFAVSLNHKGNSKTVLTDIANIVTKTNGVHTVRKDGLGDFTSVVEAVESVEDGATILIYDGVYDGTVKAFFKEIHLIGIDKNNTIIRSTNGLYAYPAMECSCGSFENLTFYAQYIQGISTEVPLGTTGAYAVHCENANGADFAKGKKLTFTNCRMISDFCPAFGCGSFADWSLELVDCDFISNQPKTRSVYNNAGSLGAFFYHDTASGTRGHSNVFIKNCTFKHTEQENTMCIYDLNNALNSVDLTFINNVSWSILNGFANSIWWRGIETPFTNNFTLDAMSYGNSENELNG